MSGLELDSQGSGGVKITFSMEAEEDLCVGQALLQGALHLNQAY